MLRSLFTRVRFALLIFPALGLFSTVQTACSGQVEDDLSHEEGAFTGYGYGYRR